MHERDPMYYWRLNNKPWVPDLSEMAEIRQALAEGRPTRFHLASRLLSAFAAGFAFAMAIAQARGLNARPWDQ